MHTLHSPYSIVNSSLYKTSVELKSSSESGKFQHQLFRNQGSINPHCWKLSLLINHGLIYTLHSHFSIVNSSLHKSSVELKPSSESGKFQHQLFRNQGSINPHCWKLSLQLNHGFDMHTLHSPYSIVNSTLYKTSVELKPSSESGKFQHQLFRNQGSINPHCWKLSL